MVQQTPSLRGRPIGLAVVFYSLLAAAALIWAVVASRPHLVYVPGQATWTLVGLGALAGLGLGLLVVLLSRLSVARMVWARELYTWFASVLGPMSRAEVLALAVLSSVGEELFFRGAMQPTAGLWITTALFGLMHLPQRRQFWPWTVSALVMGLIFGLLTDYTANLAGAIIAHFVINFLNLGHAVTFAPATPPAISPSPPSPPPEND